MNSPLVHIVIPCWNASLFIPALFESLMAQTYNNWKVVAVDDQSTDNTVEVLKQYHQQDDRITYVIRDHEPKGPSACRNIGLDLSANADYLTFVDADDLLAPYYLEQRVAFMEAHHDLDFSVFPAKRFFSDPWDECDFIIGFGDGHDDLASFMIQPAMPFSMWGCIYRPQSLLTNNLRWEERLKSIEDSDLGIQTIIKGLKYEYATDARIDYFWRTSAGSVTTKVFSQKHLKSNMFLFEKLYRSFNDEQRKTYKLPIEYWLLTFADNFHNNQELWNDFMRLPWLQNDSWFAIRINLYKHLTKNSKIRHLLFPELIRTYNIIVEQHFSVAAQKKAVLFNNKYLSDQ